MFRSPLVLQVAVAFALLLSNSPGAPQDAARPSALFGMVDAIESRLDDSGAADSPYD